jgi:hypothetical protein
VFQTDQNLYIITACTHGLSKSCWKKD